MSVASMLITIYKSSLQRNKKVEQLSAAGLSLQRDGLNIEARNYLEAALKLNIELGNKLGMANAYGNIGVVLRQMGQPKEALESHQKALEIHTELGNKLGMANDYGNIAIALSFLGRGKEASEEVEKATRLVEQLKSDASLLKLKRIRELIPSSLKKNDKKTD